MQTPAAFISSSTSILHTFFFFFMSLFFFFLFPFPTLVAGLNFSVDSSNKFNKVTLTGDANWRWASGNAFFSILVTANGNNFIKVGRATYADPLHLWDKNSGKIADFQTSFTFSISSEKNIFHGDGLTFFLAPVNSTIPENSLGGGLGLVSPWKVNSDPNDEISRFVAVEFDTFRSEWETSLPIPHVGIDVNSVNSSNATGWSNNISMMSPQWNRAWIAYDSTTMTLSVNFTGWYGEDSTAYNQTYGELSYVVDLRDQLPEYVVVGFSASVGDLNEVHEVRDWKFTSTDLLTIVDSPAPAPVDDSPAPPAADDIPAPDVYDDGTRSKKKGGLVLGLSSGLAILITLIIAVVIACRCYVKKKKKIINPRKEEGPSPDQNKDEEADLFEDSHMDDEFEKESGPKKFIYHELALSTNNFSEKQKLGEGGFGQVYKGFLKETESYVAVKRLSSRSQQGQKEYASEVKIISKLRHKNLVQFLGWCHRRGDLLLVYEYMSNKSLDYHLFKRDLIPLSWEVRYKVALGLASALLYLHEECEQCVLHRDIKSSNIMLDSTFNAKLGDFGLARSVDHEKGSHTTYIVGTRGYMAPESFTTERATRESDVYSFGVVLLEIACGKMAIEVEQQTVTKLVEFVWNLYGAGNVLDAADPKLFGEFNAVEMKSMLMVGLWCVHPDSSSRPKIREAKHVLNFEAPLLPNTIPRTMPRFMYYTAGEITTTTTDRSSTVQTASTSSSLLSPR